MSSTFVDGVTPLDAAHLNALQLRSEKAAASGYASLDSGGKVPVAQLPPYPTGIPAVVNGQWLKGVGGAAVWSAITLTDVAGLPVAGIPGWIAASGAINNGTGFTVTHPTTGQYVITLTPAGWYYPIVMLATGGAPGFISGVPNGQNFSVYTFSSATSPQDSAFVFLAVKT